MGLVLAIQVTELFLIAPLAAVGALPVFSLDVVRIGLAAVTVLLVTRGIASGLIVGATSLATFVLYLASRSGVSSQLIAFERLAAATAFDLALAAVVARLVFGPGKVNAHRLMGAVVLYLAAALLFANFYEICSIFFKRPFDVKPNASENTLSQLLYFSLSTLTTTGFGDITPAHPVVRSLSNLEAVLGQLYTAIFLARLVTLQTSSPREKVGGVQPE